MFKHVLVASVIGLLILSIPVSADPNGPLAHYTFDAGNFDDVSGNGYHGSAMGDAQIVDGALLLDGNGDYVQTSLLEPLKIADGFTMAAWFKNTWSDGLGQHILWVGNSEGNGYGHHQEAHLSRNFYTSSSYDNPYTDNLVFNFADGHNHEGAVVNIIAEEKFDGIDEWHHIAAMVSIDPNENPINPDDPNDPNNFVTSGALYVDGVWQKPADHGWPSILTVSHAVARDEWDVALRIGISGATDRRGFHGMIDDVEIYDRALSVDEIQSVMRINMQQAWGPSPADGQIVDIRDTSQLVWSPGDGAVGHDIYFGTDRDAVATAQSDDTTGLYLGRKEETTLTLPNSPEWGQSYYWRIDEVDEAGNLTPGVVWTFSIADYLYVDDMESYSVGGREIWDFWTDGYDNPSENGAVVGVGKDYAPETTIVHGGKQSLPILYGASSAPTSEAIREFDTPQNWTEYGVDTLSLYICGQISNSIMPVYVTIKDSTNAEVTVPHSDSQLVTVTDWQQWTIPLSELSGLDLARISVMIIGVDHGNSWGMGTFYVDDIQVLAME